MLKKVVITFVLSALVFSLSAQIFEPVSSDLQGVMEPLAAWVSLDESIRPNAFLSGEYYIKDRQTIVSQYVKLHNKGNFYHTNSPFPALYRGAVAVADYDKDGDDDIIMTGINRENTLIIRLFRQEDNGQFTQIKEMFTPVTDGSIEWGDFDNDEDLDLLITGKEYNNALSTRIYRNDAGIFTDISTGLPGVYNGNATWADFDKDKDLDVLITGDAGNRPLTAIYRNDNGKFIRLGAQLAPLQNSAGAWGDLDGDGDQDILLSGEDGNGYPVVFAYANQSNTYFAQMQVAMRPLKHCTIDLGDFDHDGDPDVVMTGESLERSYTLIYENKGGFVFEPIITGIPGVASGTAIWGDYDLDGDLDLMVAGLTICFDFVGQIYRNNLNPVIEQDEENIFIDAPITDLSIGPFYYYVFSSCYCDPLGGDDIAYHLYVSNVHLQKQRYELNYKFNDLLLKEVPNWGETDRGYRTSNGFATKKEAEEARKQLIESYRVTNYKIHHLDW